GSRGCVYFSKTVGLSHSDLKLEEALYKQPARPEQQQRDRQAVKREFEPDPQPFSSHFVFNERGLASRIQRDLGGNLSFGGFTSGRFPFSVCEYEQSEY